MTASRHTEAPNQEYATFIRRSIVWFGLPVALVTAFTTYTNRFGHTAEALLTRRFVFYLLAYLLGGVLGGWLYGSIMWRAIGRKTLKDN